MGRQTQELELREEIWGETAGIEGHLRDDMEIKCNGNFLKYVKMILMRSPNNGEDQSQQWSIADPLNLYFRFPLSIFMIFLIV